MAQLSLENVASIAFATAKEKSLRYQTLRSDPPTWVSPRA